MKPELAENETRKPLDEPPPDIYKLAVCRPPQRSQLPRPYRGYDWLPGLHRRWKYPEGMGTRLVSRSGTRGSQPRGLSSQILELSCLQALLCHYRVFQIFWKDVPLGTAVCGSFEPSRRPRARRARHGDVLRV